MKSSNYQETPSSNPFAATEVGVSACPFAQISGPDPFVAVAKAQQTSAREPEALVPWGPYAGLHDSETKRNDLSSERATLEILVTFGSSVLHVAHLCPPRSVVMGQLSSSIDDSISFRVPEHLLTAARQALVLVEGGKISLLVPQCAGGFYESAGTTRPFASRTASAEVSAASAALDPIELEGGGRATIDLGPIQIFVRLVPNAVPFERGVLANWDWSVPSYFGMTGAVMGAMMAALAYFVPPMGLLDEGSLDKDRLLLISQYLEAASERERVAEPTPASEPGAVADGASGKAAAGAEGAAGKPELPNAHKRLAVKGPRDNPELQLSRVEAVALAREFGMIGMLSAANTGDPNAPTSVFGRDSTLGADDVSANGNLWADEIGESGGMGGLRLSGDGSGGGDLFGNAVGISLGNIGVGGPGLGKEGWGIDRGARKSGHAARGPSLHMLPPVAQGGHIPAHVIQRTVRQNFGRFRMCYQQGLARNPTLEGRVPVRFVIGRDGAVSSVSAQGGLADDAVRSCIQSAFYGLSFPPPENGVVMVTYPLLFSPE